MATRGADSDVASLCERSSDDVGGARRTYQVRTYGCQMNVHDSERLAGLLEAAGYERAADGVDADVVVFNTCAVRENADNKLYGNISHLVPRKEANPDMQIAVGGCLAQKDRDAVLKRAPWVDVVFGTHNIGSLPTLLGQAWRHPCGGAVAGRAGRPGDHPARAERQRLRRLVRRSGGPQRPQRLRKTVACLWAHRGSGAGALH